MSLIAPTIMETVWNLLKNWRVMAIIAGLIIVLVGVALIFKACHRGPKLNQKETVQAQQAIEKNDREQMTKILVESEVREQGLDADVINAKANTFNAVVESKKKWADASNEDMRAELERRAQE